MKATILTNTQLLRQCIAKYLKGEMDFPDFSEARRVYMVLPLDSDPADVFFTSAVGLGMNRMLQGKMTEQELRNTFIDLLAK